MKIDGNRSNPEIATPKRVDGTQADRPGRTGHSTTRDGDHVRVSSDAQLATSAAAAAKAAPDVRQERVAELRKAFQAGKVGADVHRLADRMLDSMLGR